MFQRATLGQRAVKEESEALICLDGCSQVASRARELICLCLHSLPEGGRTSLLQYHGIASTRRAWLARGLRVLQYSRGNMWLLLYWLCYWSGCCKLLKCGTDCIYWKISFAHLASFWCSCWKKKKDGVHFFSIFLCFSDKNIWSTNHSYNKM